MTPPGLESGPTTAEDLGLSRIAPPSQPVTPHIPDNQISVDEPLSGPTCDRCVTAGKLVKEALAAERDGDRVRMRALLEACLALCAPDQLSGRSRQDATDNSGHPDPDKESVS